MDEKLNFLDIQYAWSNGKQLVLFIPEEQYTEKIIQMFDKIKQNDWYLAIATNVYGISNYETDIFTLALYQHGYYDIMLNGDYRVIPYKRTYLGKEYPKKMMLDEFKKTFVFNERRLKLYNDFVTCISSIKSLVKINSVKVGGSFVEGKENPDDIDVLLFISEDEFSKINNDKELYHQYQELIFPWLLKKQGFELDIRVFTEKNIKLAECASDVDDDYIKHLCERGYCATLYTNCYEEDAKCYIHNLIRISDF